MSTALYLRVGTTANSGTLPSGHQSATSPGVTATGGTTNRNLSLGIGAAVTNLTATTVATTSAQNGLLGMFMSEPLLGAQTVGGGSLTLDAAEQESNLLANFWINGLEIYVWRPGTGAKVGTVKAFGAASLGGTEPTSAGATQSTHITGITTSAISALDGDIVVCEVWSEWTQSMATAYTGGLYFDGGTAIASENDAGNAAVITFAETLTFKGGWAPTDKNSNLVLSGSNLIATGAVGLLSQLARSATWRSTGKYYAQCQLTTRNSSHHSCVIGFAGTQLLLAAGGFAGQTADSWALYNDGQLWNNGAQFAATGLTITAGQWARLAVDFDAGKGWIGNQTSWYGGGDPAAGTTPSFTFTANTRVALVIDPYSDTGVSDSVTANLGGSAFNDALPTGYTSWDGSQTGPSTGSAAGVGTATGVGASTAVSDGASAGVGAASGVGKSTAAAPGSSAGVGAATGVGSSTAQSPGSSAGTGAATGTGQSTAESPGASAGLGSALAVGQSTAVSVGSSSGTGTATAVGTGITPGDGAAAGVGGAAAIGQSTAAATGSSAGVGDAQAVGASIATSDGASSGVGAALAVGASTAESPGAASGTGDGTGVGASTAVSDGAAAGAGTGTGIGVALVEGTGSAAGTSTADGVALLPGSADGVAAGTGSATAVGQSTAEATGTSAEVGSADAVGASTVLADGSASGVGDAGGIGASNVEGTGSAAGVGDAAGAGMALYDAIGAAAGIGLALGTGASTVTATGQAQGTCQAFGSGFSWKALADHDKMISALVLRGEAFTTSVFAEARAVNRRAESSVITVTPVVVVTTESPEHTSTQRYLEVEVTQ